MWRAALFLAFFGVGLSPFERLFFYYGVPDVLPYPYLSFCLPALCIGLFDLVATRGRVLTPPVVAAGGVAAASLLWIDPTERGRGLLVFSTLVTGVPIAATIHRRQAHHSCAVAFVAATLTLVVLALSEYRPGLRLGFFGVPGYGQVSDPNEFGAQLVAAALVVGAYLRSGPRAGGLLAAAATASLIIFTVAVALTASRGALLNLVATGLMLFASGRAQAKVQAAVAGAVALIASAPFLQGLLSPAMARFVERGNLGSFGDRLEIWLAAWDGRQEIGWLGVGVGGVEKHIAAYTVHDATATGLDGVDRLYSHNGAVEWVVALGVPGIVAGLWVLASFARRAAVLDRVDRGSVRIAILTFIASLSMSLVTFRQPWWPALSALFLATFASPLVTDSLSFPCAAASPRFAPRRPPLRFGQKRVPHIT